MVFRPSTPIAQGRRFGVAALLVFAFGCGGRVIEPGSEGPETTAAGGSSGAAASEGGAPGKRSSGALPTHPLGPCKPGFDRASNPTRACQWLTNAGQCFETFDAACACACPTSGGSVCSSSFPGGPDSATRVFCDQI